MHQYQVAIVAVVACSLAALRIDHSHWESGRIVPEDHNVEEAGRIVRIDHRGIVAGFAVAVVVGGKAVLGQTLEDMVLVRLEGGPVVVAQAVFAVEAVTVAVAAAVVVAVVAVDVVAVAEMVACRMLEVDRPLVEAVAAAVVVDDGGVDEDTAAA